MPYDRVEVAVNQGNFYRKNFHRLLTITIVLAVINIVLLGLIFYQIITRTPVTYFATTTDGRLIPVRPIK